MEILAELKPYLLATLVLLLAGKGFRRLIFLPIEWIVRKTKTKVDDVILTEAQKDVGIEKPTLPEEPN